MEEAYLNSLLRSSGYCWENCELRAALSKEEWWLLRPFRQHSEWETG